MITTRWGNQVKVVHWFDYKTGDANYTITFGPIEPDLTRTTHVSELRADGGVQEIIAAALEIRG
jgi:hypothetical protein